MNKTNIIAVLLLFVIAGMATANETENGAPTIMSVTGLNECHAVCVPINMIVGVGNPDDAYDMDNMTVTANFTGDGDNASVTLVVVECGNGSNCTIRYYNGTITMDVASVNVTCEINVTALTGENDTWSYVFHVLNPVESIVIDDGHRSNFTALNTALGMCDFNATCNNTCEQVVNCTDVEWSCSNKYVATIDASTGELVANHAGVAVVTATSGDVSDTVNITVNSLVSWVNYTECRVTGVVDATSGDTTLVVDLGTGTGSVFVYEIGDPASYNDTCGDIDDMVVKGAHVYARDWDGNGTCNYTYTLTMCYNASNVAALGIDADTLTVMKCDGNWTEVGGVVNDGTCVTVNIDGSGTYALVGTAQTEDDDDDDPAPAQQHSSGSSRDGTYPPEPFDDDSDDSDSDSDDTDDAVVIDDAVVVPDPVDIPDVVETPTTENTLDADIEHPDDDDGVNILWLFAGAVAIIAIGCAAVIKRRT